MNPLEKRALPDGARTALSAVPAVSPDRRADKAVRAPAAMCALVLSFICISLAAAQSSERMVNGGFENGLSGWHSSGAVHLETNHPVAGKFAAVIGPGRGSLSQRIEIDRANDFTFSARVKASTTNGWSLSLRFLDKDAHELMTVDSHHDLKRSHSDARKFEHFMKPHPLTKWVEILFTTESVDTSLLVDQVKLDMKDQNAASLRPACDLDQAVQPFWIGNKVFNEAVLLVSRDGKPASGRLMFQPSKIISVQDYGLSTNYVEGADYTINSRTISAMASRIPQIRDEDLEKGELKWNTVGGKQVMVTYEHSDAWNGPMPSYLGQYLPNTLNKLRARAPLTIVAYGDSITHGIGASRLSHIRPFLPPWPEMFVHRLKAVYSDNDIHLYNSAQSGAKSDWGKEYAEPMVASLQPDLVLIAFGQNDFWGVPPDSFAENISGIIKTVRDKKADAEFLLISPLRFDPAYTSNHEYWNAVGDYEKKLKAMTGPGIQFVDMTALSESVYATKKPLDCLNDPLHPNDYFSRWYAQAVAAALEPPPTAPIASQTANKDLIPVEFPAR